jgi:hypothetical protein
MSDMFWALVGWTVIAMFAGILVFETAKRLVGE